jgi:hypothetical protein
MDVIDHTAAARSSVPYHFAVPLSYDDEDAVCSVDGSTSGSSALFVGFERTAIALLRPASASEKASSFSLLKLPERAFDVV